MSHLDDGMLHALLDGEIPSNELTEVQAHLAACAECRTRLEQERVFATVALDLVQMIEVPEEAPTMAAAPVQAAASLGGSTPHARARRINWARGFAWAASVIGAVGLGYEARGFLGTSNAAPLAVHDSAQPVVTNLETRRAEAAPSEPPGDAPQPSPAPAPPPPSRQLAGRSNQVRAQVDTPARLDEMRPAPSAPPPAAPPTADQNASGGAAARDARELRARLEAPSGLVQMKAASAIEPLAFPEALRRLDGSIRLIQGLIPIRLEAQGSEVRVVYPALQGELILHQELVNGRLVFRLTGPPGFPADSLERLRERVRE